VKIYVYPADRTGCGFFRLIWPAQALAAKGYEIRIMDPKHRSFNAMVEGVDGAPFTDRVIDVSIPRDADVIVLQRITHRHIAEAISIIRSKGVGVVVDVDDDLSAIHPKHPAFVNLHPSKDPKRVNNQDSLYHSWHHTAKACSDATVVTTSSDALKDRYAKHGRGVVIRNYLPDFYTQVPHTDSDLVGWGGSVQSHPDDLDVVGRSIQRIVNDGHKFKMIGPEWGVAETLGLTSIDATGPIPIRDWPEALTELGIGIAPIRDTKFNEAKSWLKPLEYAGLGIPCVMSPRREYREINKLGIGILAEKQDQWYKRLKKLIEDVAYRQDMSAQSRAIAETMTIPLHAWRWAEAWELAYETR
jgi:hypothetical protein